MDARRYQSRSVGSLSLSRRVHRWNQGNLCSSCCTNSGSGHASANLRIYLRFLGEKPFTIREGRLEVMGKAVGDLGAPALFALLVEDVAPELPIELHDL